MNNNSYIVGGYAMDRSIASITERDARMLTHLFLAFAVIEEGEVTDRRITRIGDVSRIREYNPQLRILVSVGGWGAGGFSESAATREGRRRFAESAVAIVERHGLDGIDIDWEYPCYSAAGIESSPDDRRTYTLLMEELRASLDGLAERTGHRYELTTAVGADRYYVDGSEMDRVGEICEWVNVMTYDMRGGFQTLTGHHTGLHASTGDLFRISAETSLRMYEDAGVPRSKLVLGAAFYSRRWTEVPAMRDGLFQMSPGPGLHGPRYTQIVRDIIPAGEFMRHWDGEAQAPWLFNGSTFLSYDDPESLAAKCAFVQEHGYAGIFYWEHGADETRTLLEALARGLHVPVSTGGEKSQ